MTGKELAEKFHEAYERLAPNFGYETREETREFDAESPNGKLMIAVCEEIIDVLTIRDVTWKSYTMAEMENMHVCPKCASESIVMHEVWYCHICGEEDFQPIKLSEFIEKHMVNGDD